MLLGKDKLNTIEVLISKALIDSYISMTNLLREYYEMKKVKNLKTSVEYII